jgi:hypothetical protein
MPQGESHFVKPLRKVSTVGSSSSQAIDNNKAQGLQKNGILSGLNKCLLKRT